MMPSTRFYIYDNSIIPSSVFPSSLSTRRNRTGAAVAWCLGKASAALSPPWLSDADPGMLLPALIIGPTSVNGHGVASGAASAAAAAAAFDMSRMAGALALRGADASLTLRALTLANLPAAGLYPFPLPPSGR
ncbi:hypothetical protein GPECTOR_28g829 [Gonium pectorale]|uniref:Uncharacterized protein n=1 Tax=Gonium pectorale TaxID=33097 RepID=A0A150GEY6_GONPE|nr:hypothetical protein GPECTOR_28g829 [Gonium pectorale]|eukprot:KXZ48421.1 hypothetical protein GPECTOR_28g829 [Gonium pectorale]